MFKHLALLTAVGCAFALAVFAAADKAADEPKQLPVPEMKFNEVKEIAPGVFFRYSSIAANDPKIPFGGSNHIWIVFKDYVVVIDANFPKEAADVIADIKKTTKKPIKYVLDTHHHGDHAYGNCVWAKEGAQIIASKPTARLLKANGPKQWEDAAKDRKDIKENELKQVDITFDDKYVLERRHAARRVPRLRPQPHHRRRGRVPAEAQDPLHRRRLRERRVQLHGPLELRDLDQVPRRDGRSSTST